MRSFIRRTTTLALLGALAVASGLPAAAQSGQIESLSHRQSIKTELSNTGEAGTSRVFTQLKATGNGEVAVTLPQQSTRGLRNLEGFGKPDVNGDDVIWTLDASEDGFARSVADNTADLPVSVSVVYRLDGAEVSPNDLAGRTGKVEVEYTVRNLTAEPREIISFDAENNKYTETMDVAVPMVGSLSLTLPASFANIDAPGGVTVGDGRGNTVINFSLLLFAPLGSEEQTIAWSADAVDTAIPETSLQVLPVDDTSFNSLNATADAYKGASASLSELANGALIINSNLLLLGSGASQLLDGLNQLADGAGQLNDGLANTAAPGARQLSDGMSKAREGGGKLSTGLGELALGATRLSDGLGTAQAGAGQLASGLPQLRDGLVSVRDGLSGLQGGVGGPQDDADDGTVIGGLNSLRAGIAGLPQNVQEGIAQNLNATLQNIVLPQLKTSLQNGLQTNLAGGIAGGMGDPLEEALRNALQQQFGPGLVAQLGPVLETGLRGALQDDFRPQLQAASEPQLAAGLANSLINDLGPLLETGLATNLAGALQAPPASLDAATATAVANGFAAAFVAGLGPNFTAYATQFAAGYTAQSTAPLNAAFADFAEQFTAGFQAQLPAALNPGFATFAAAFSPQFAQGFGPAFAAVFAPAFADGFAAQVSPSFKQLSDQFAVGFADGLGDSLNEAAIPGFDKLLAGMSNERCDTDNPRDPNNPCGIRQVLALLRGGAGQLTDGAGAAADGSKALASGLGQLADGGGQLAAGAGTAASGSRDLASGLVQLDDGALKLANGLGDAADGSGKLADGLNSAEEGGEKIANGVGALQEGFEERLIGGVSSGRQGASQDYEQVKAVIARGREGAAPYGIADGADATTVFQFDLAGVGTEEGPSTPLLVVIALVALAAAGGLGLALRRRLTA